MLCKVEIRGKEYAIDLAKPIDLSVHLKTGPDRLAAWYVDPLTITPVRTDQFTGSVAEGGVVNFRDVFFNPHGHGTHTECVGHITEEVYSVAACLQMNHMLADVVTVRPVRLEEGTGFSEKGDLVITKKSLELACKEPHGDAIVIRTLPNDCEKKTRKYSGQNPPYMWLDAMQWVLDNGYKHLLIDLPSVDRETDDGKLECHHLFWNVPANPDKEKTISELVYVPDHVKDGLYFLQLEVAPLVNDASPSRPKLFALS